jgi:RNA polymerase sigma factor (sigma-70 family)
MSPTNSLLRQLCKAVAWDLSGISDGQLLERYATERDEAAFEALVRRHGPMVLGVCRRLLRDPDEANDAFQATFLVLVRKAASVFPREMLPNWLHGVAYRTAVRARSAVFKRRRREKQMRQMPEPAVRSPDPWDDLRALLDQHLACLPSKYRVAVVLCDLEGKAHKEAARDLGWPVGTLASRLSRGRRMLAARIIRRGGLVSAAALLHESAAACVPGTLVLAAVRAARLDGLEEAVAAATISVKIFALKQGVLRAMVLEKLKAVVTGIFAISLAFLGGGLLIGKPAAAEQPGAQANDKANRVAPGSAEEKGKRPVASSTEKIEKGRFELIADGKKIRIRAVYADKEVLAEAGRILYDEDQDQLFLEASGTESVTMQIKRAGSAEEKGKRPAASTSPKIAKGRFQVTADGTNVRIRVIYPDKEVVAEAGRVLYDEEKDLLILYAGHDDARLEIKLAGQPAQTLSGHRITYRPNSGEVRVEGSTGVRLNVPMLGPLPLALDFGFPIAKTAHENTQVFSYFLGFFR